MYSLYFCHLGVVLWLSASSYLLFCVGLCASWSTCGGQRTPYGISFLFPLGCGFRNPAQTGSRAFYPRAISCLPDLCCCLCSFSSFKKYLFILSLALNPGPPMSASQLLSLWTGVSMPGLITRRSLCSGVVQWIEFLQLDFLLEQL